MKWFKWYPPNPDTLTTRERTMKVIHHKNGDPNDNHLSNLETREQVRETIAESERLDWRIENALEEFRGRVIRNAVCTCKAGECHHEDAWIEARSALRAWIRHALLKAYDDGRTRSQ